MLRWLSNWRMLMKNDDPENLNPNDCYQARLFLDRVDDPTLNPKVISIGMPSSQLTKLPDYKRRNFGVGLLILAIFILVLFLGLPKDNARWIFFGFSWITLLIGAWQVDLSRR